MNPSTKELLDAVNNVNADSVIILPNNKTSSWLLRAV